MMKQILILVVFSFFGIIACNRTSDSYNYIEFPKTFTIPRAELDSLEVPVELLRVYNMQISGKYLITMTPQEEPIFNIFDLNKKEYRGGFGKIGNGPGEFLLPIPSSMAKGEKNSFFILDNKYAYNIVFPEDSVVHSKNVVFNKICRIPTKVGILNGAFPLDEHSICGIADSQDKELTYCSDDNQSHTMIDYPDLVPIPEGVRLSTIPNLYRTVVECSADKLKVAMLYYRFPLIRIWDMKKESFVACNFLKNVDIPSIEIQGNMILPVKPQSFYINSYSTAKYIYGVYSSGRENVQEIHVFDWNGRGICKIDILDCHYSCFAVSPDDSVIYFTSPRSEYKIYSHSLKNILN